MTNTLGEIFLKELESEIEASRKCIERIPENLFNWKPHKKSMEMGYLTLLVADIPKWISSIIENGEIDFGNWESFDKESFKNVVFRFEKNVEEAKKALKNMPDKAMDDTFFLKNKGIELMRASKEDSIISALNHMVHHRGQLTVYMRLNDIPVPSIYGPSADTKAGNL